MASSRTNKQDSFQHGIAILQPTAKGDLYARSNVNFLLGFDARMRGNLPEAEKFMREAYDDSPGNFQAARELASICLVRNDLTSAETFARKAYAAAPDNPYILDILLSVLIRLPDSNKRAVREEMQLLFEKLKQVGEEEGRSFYVTRRAEYELKYGSTIEATRLVDEAVRKTPGIFQIHALRAEIYLERGTKAVAFEEIKRMRDIVYKETGRDRLSNLRPLLELEASYFEATGDYSSAKSIYRRKDLFTDAEAEAAIKAIDTTQAFKHHNQR